MTGYGTELPIPSVRFHGESWRVSGRATEIAETTFMTPLLKTLFDVLILFAICGGIG